MTGGWERRSCFVWVAGASDEVVVVVTVLRDEIGEGKGFAETILAD